LLATVSAFLALLLAARRIPCAGLIALFPALVLLVIASHPALALATHALLILGPLLPTALSLLLLLIFALLPLVFAVVRVAVRHASSSSCGRKKSGLRPRVRLTTALPLHRLLSPVLSVTGLVRRPGIEPDDLPLEERALFR
jgi:hypothetical protein